MLDKIISNYWGLRFLSKRRHFLTYLIIYFVIILTISLFVEINYPKSNSFLIPFFGYCGLIILAIPEFSFIRGLSEYLNEYDVNLRRKIFDDTIFIKNAMPIISTFGMLRFLRIKNDKLDDNLINIKINIKSLYSGVILYFILTVIIMTILLII